MGKERPLILLSNDDGVEAKGLHELIKTLRPIADLFVVAPDGPRSGASSSITSGYPLRCCPVKLEPGLFIYKCTGTPVDCVKLVMNTSAFMMGVKQSALIDKLALHNFIPLRPNMVIGGINHGDNSSVNVHYSGTMGVVIEGCLKHIPSVGFSLCDHSADADFSVALPYVRRITEEVLQNGLPAGTCLNVNIPSGKQLNGVRICRQAAGVWMNEFEMIGERYWLTGVYQNNEPEAEDTDHWALEHGYVAITPTQIDMTDYEVMDKLNGWNWEV